MRISHALSILALIAMAACGSSSGDTSPSRERQTAELAKAQPVMLTAADGVVIAGIHHAATAPRAIVLLFHQAGANKNEYREIAPRLAAAGYSTLAIDQRSGGDLFGGRNETVARLGRSSGYMAAKADLDAALAWGKGQRLPVMLWGSSYSASLVFLVAAENPASVTALLAFSPGEYLESDGVVRRAAARIAVPMFATAASDSAELSEMRRIVEVSPASTKTLFEPKRNGVHGSSTLVPARNPQGAEENWEAVLAFLRSIAA